MSRLFTLVCLALLPSAVAAQGSALIDDGTFTISRKGAPIGRESFRIARIATPGGIGYRGTGTTVVEDRRYTTSLSTDSVGIPVAYDSRSYVNGVSVNWLRGRGRPGRFSLLADTPGGQSAREYVLDNGALLIEDEVFHHFYFVRLAAAASSRVVVITPRMAQQSPYQLVDRGPETVEIAGVRVAGRRWSVTAEDASWNVWIDAAGRLLKVSIPEKGLTALRDDPPR